MAISKIKLPDNSVQDIHDARGVDTNGSFYFVQGSSSAAGSSTDGEYLSVKWEGTVPGVSAAYDGLKIAYRIATRTGISSAGVVLSIDNGSHYYPVVIQKNTMVTTHYPVGATFLAVFNSTQTATAYLTAGTKSTVTGCWQIMEYDSNTNTYQREYKSTGDAEYPITTRYNTTTGESYYAEYGRYSESVTLNPSTNKITASGFRVTNGTSSQFLKADGSTDSSAYCKPDADGYLITASGGGIRGFTGGDGDLYALGSGNADGGEDHILATTDQLPSSSSLLPSVTSSDNGKVLKVSNGAWTASADNVFVATYGSTTYSAISGAVSAGKVVVANRNGYGQYIYIADIFGVGYLFTHTDTEEGKIYSVYVDSSNVWSSSSSNIPTGLPSVTSSDNGKILQVSSGAWSVAAAPSGGDTNVIETVKVNGTALTVTSKAVDITVPVRSTIQGWGFADVSSGTLSATSQPAKIETASGEVYAIGSSNSDGTEDYVIATTDQIPTVPTNVSSFTNDANYVKYVLCADEAAYTAISTKDSGTLYLIPKTS